MLVTASKEWVLGTGEIMGFSRVPYVLNITFGGKSSRTVAPDTLFIPCCRLTPRTGKVIQRAQVAGQRAEKQIILGRDLPRW